VRPDVTSFCVVYCVTRFGAKSTVLYDDARPRGSTEVETPTFRERKRIARVSTQHTAKRLMGLPVGPLGRHFLGRFSLHTCGHLVRLRVQTTRESEPIMLIQTGVR
jgi:hypothetical protein